MRLKSSGFPSGHHSWRVMIIGGAICTQLLQQVVSSTESVSYTHLRKVGGQIQVVQADEQHGYCKDQHISDQERVDGPEHRMLNDLTLIL